MEKDSGVSTVLSEVLMIALVLILVPVVTISLMNQLPEDRVPTVNIIMDVSPTEGTPEKVILYHKGGDYIRKEEISIFIRIKNPNGDIFESPRYREKNRENPEEELEFSSESRVFDLGDNIQTPKVKIFEKLLPGSTISVSLITKNSVIFPGEKKYEG